ncbi:hypothetical protein TcCL_NonESM00216 [Trypanosoma cruzi]|nr:hypothetical protein TcCL_NonESM00216 [Trypanosoma cruzi]
MQRKLPRSESPRNDAPSTMSIATTTHGGLTRSTGLSSLSLEEEDSRQRGPLQARSQHVMTFVGELPWVPHDDTDNEQPPREEDVVTGNIPRQIFIEDENVFLSRFVRPARLVAPAPAEGQTSGTNSGGRDGRSRRRWLPLRMDYMG